MVPTKTNGKTRSEKKCLRLYREFAGSPICAHCVSHHACFLPPCRIKSISVNGLLTIHYPGVLERGEEEHYADPSDMEVVDIKQCKSALEVYDVGTPFF